MKIKLLIVLLFLFNFSSLEATQHDKHNSNRIALVIGNGNYPLSPLDNPENDAADIAHSLESLGFTVIFKQNLSNNAFRNELRTFGEQLKKYDVGLFFFAGHGVQVNGVNYLLPVDADIQYEDEIQSQAIEADLVLRKMKSAKIDVNILILDACRNNPFSRGFRGITPGLAVMNAPKGTLIAYSTAPGNTAEDGRGRNSPYTEYLLKNIKTPGITIEKLFKYVRIGLNLETKGRQISWESSSLMGDFYFISPDYFDVKKSNNTMTGAVEIHLNMLDNPLVSIDGQYIDSCINNICNSELSIGTHIIQIKTSQRSIKKNIIIYPGQKNIVNISNMDDAIMRNQTKSPLRRPLRRLKKNRSNFLPPP